MDTIFATSSGRPPAAIAIVRISGPNAVVVACTLAGTLPPARMAGLRVLRDEQTGVLDRALVLFSPAPGSATGEDVVEFHCHGGRAVVTSIEQALARRAGVRLAEPGEFTRQALANGRIDLAEAEGLADLIAAETEMQRVAALGASEGRISRVVREWSQRLVILSAEVEASLDWSDEGDVDATVSLDRSVAAMGELRDEIAAALATPPIERLRDGIVVVIAGPPNAGKSTLFNVMVDRAAAIVSPIAGTTRDMIEAPVTRNGIAYLLTDTAGVHDSNDDSIERQGIARARAAVDRADVVLWLADEPPLRHDAIRVHARADLPGRSLKPDGADVAISAADASSFGALWNIIEKRAGELLPRLGALPLLARHRALCARAVEELTISVADPLLIAESLRLAHAALAEITGARASEAMLDALFTRFCVGK